MRRPDRRSMPLMPLSWTKISKNVGGVSSEKEFSRLSEDGRRSKAKEPLCTLQAEVFEAEHRKSTAKFTDESPMECE